MYCAGVSAPPKRHNISLSYEKPEPYIVMFVPPLTVPIEGIIDITTTGAMYTNLILFETAGTPSSAIITETGPVDTDDGVTHSIKLLFITSAGTATFPKIHVALAVEVNDIPCTVINVPPNKLPRTGATPVTTALSTKRNDKVPSVMIEPSDAILRETELLELIAGDKHTRLESDKTVPTTDTLGPNTHDTFPESPENPTPLIVNSVPPVNEPTEGATDCTEADCLYVKFWPIATDPALETVAMTTPATWGGDTHIT